MKIDPISVLLNSDFKKDTNVFLISGNEKTFIEKIKDFLIEAFRADNSIEVIRIENVKSVDENVGLFSNKRLFVINGIDGLNIEYLKLLVEKDDYFIFVAENSTKNNSVKRLFTNQKNCSLVECYELDKTAKTKILNKFLNDNNIKLDKNLFWYLVEVLDNKYGLLEKELYKIREIDTKDISYQNLNKLISKNVSLDDKIFFKLLEKNELIINSYNEKITNHTEFNNMFFSIKQFINLIITSDNEDDFQKNIPRYLFREKKIFLNMFKKITSEKKRLLINLMFKTEGLIRKNNNFSTVLGLRFLLNLRKIFIS